MAKQQQSDNLQPDILQVTIPEHDCTLTQQEEFDIVIELSEKQFELTGTTRQTCNYCGQSLLSLHDGTFKKKNYIEDEDDLDYEDRPMRCPACGQIDNSL
ncbi:MAG: hypothetical protein QNJ37_04680 [Crocosphaera sp.]|nr:hypothetical protein [Crocosphaera sp.]